MIAEVFTYSARVASIAPAASITSAIQIQGDARFLLQKMTMFADIGGAGQTESSRVVPLVYFSMVDTGSSRNFTDQPIPLGTMFGSGGLPFIMPNQKIFERNSSISLTFTNFDAVNTYRLAIALIGTKLFDR